MPIYQEASLSWGNGILDTVKDWIHLISACLMEKFACAISFNLMLICSFNNNCY